jgi:hypothetical protein
MVTAGYSGTPLARKLGIGERQTVAVLNEPAGFPSAQPMSLSGSAFRCSFCTALAPTRSTNAWPDRWSVASLTAIWWPLTERDTSGPRCRPRRWPPNSCARVPGLESERARRPTRRSILPLRGCEVGDLASHLRGALVWEEVTRALEQT